MLIVAYLSGMEDVCAGAAGGFGSTLSQEFDLHQLQNGIFKYAVVTAYKFKCWTSALTPLFTSGYFKSPLLLKDKFWNAVSSQICCDSDTSFYTGMFSCLVFREVFPWNGTLSFGWTVWRLH